MTAMGAFLFGFFAPVGFGAFLLTCLALWAGYEYIKEKCNGRN
jgi:hypothetical protein